MKDNTGMKVTDFSFDLPASLIAFYPQEKRSASRLLQLDGLTGACEHKQFTEIVSWLNPGDLLVFNDTKVIPARLYGQKQTGGKIEILVERILDNQHVLAHIKASKKPKVDEVFQIDGGYPVKLLSREGVLFKLAFLTAQPVLQILKAVGHVPLPPYIQRQDGNLDQQRYQTVYAQKEGAVAAPTAGLHFDEALLQAIRNKGVQTEFITLHVGSGTFQPVRVDDVRKHTMHSEYFEVSQYVIDKIRATRRTGHRVVGVGTTSVRALESAFLHLNENQSVTTVTGETDIFIYPGYQFVAIDAIITNFHLPESTLLMLVSAFAGYHNIMHAYQEAIAKKYRFFSYGDAMLLTCQTALSLTQRVLELPSTCIG